MNPLRGFPPLVSSKSRVLILGSMPGAASLQAQQYYAHSQNLFWPFMQELFSIPAGFSYALRCSKLTAQGVAVWDVLEGCERIGSLDARIRNEKANDFAAFFAEHWRIHTVFLNGKKAESLFRKLVQPHLRDLSNKLNLVGLPSTSPAHAAMSRAEKLKVWRQIKETLQR